jgi:hypothetical protein
VYGFWIKARLNGGQKGDEKSGAATKCLCLSFKVRIDDPIPAGSDLELLNRPRTPIKTFRSS